MTQVSSILKRDMELFFNDLESEYEVSSTSSDINLVADFT